MGGTIRVKGYFGDANGNSIPGEAFVSFVSHGISETLTIGFDGYYRCDVPYRPVEALVSEVRRSADGISTTERHTVLQGYYTDQGRRLVSGKVTVWIRRNRELEMLTAEFERKGQISVPFGPIAALVGRDRRSRI